MKSGTKIYTLFDENYYPARVKEMMLKAFADGKDKLITNIEIEII